MIDQTLPKTNDQGKHAGSGLWYARGMYLGYYMSIGAYMPFINLYFERLGLSGIEISSLMAITVLISSSTTLLWGGIADARRWHKGILRAALLLSPLAIFMVSRAADYRALIPMVVLYALFRSPIVPLIDSASLEIAQSHRRSFGNLRVWGAIGWSISTWVVGTLIQNFSIQWLFTSYIIFMLMTFGVSLFQPPRANILKTSLVPGLRKLFRFEFIIILLSFFLVALTSSAGMNFFSLYMDEIGATEGLIGFAWTLSSLSEIPVMLASGAIIKRVGTRGILKIAFLIYAARWLLLSLISNPVLALFVQLLHGLSFGTYIVGAVTYVNQEAPEGLGTTAQSVFSIVSFGLASMAGAMLGGYMFDTLGLSVLFRLLSVIALVGFLIFILSGKRKNENKVS
jgi:PPP family 3-phenylpropionic acid transporter